MIASLFRIYEVVRKEMTQILRSKRSFRVIVITPILQLFIYGYVVTTDVNAPFNYQLAASNNPTSFGATNLPPGVSLNTSSGAISGTPSVAGVYVVNVTATNAYGTSLKRTLSLTVGNYSSITSSSTITGTVGSAFSYTLTANNSPFTYNLSGLPAGLTYNDVSGVVSGTPTTPGSYTVPPSLVEDMYRPAVRGIGKAEPVKISVVEP